MTIPPGTPLRWHPRVRVEGDRYIGVARWVEDGVVVIDPPAAEGITRPWVVASVEHVEVVE